MNPAVQKMREILAAASTEIMKISVPPAEPEVKILQGFVAMLLAEIEKDLKL